MSLDGKNMTRRFFPLLFVLGCLLAGRLIANPVEDFSVKDVEKLGKEIFERDQMAAVATDLMLAQGLDLSRYPLRGWVTERNGKNSLVTFVGDYDGEHLAIFQIEQKGKKAPSFSKVEKQALTRYQSAAFKARLLASGAFDEFCSDSYNIAVLPDIDGDGFLVYALAATRDPDAVLVGGHYRFRVSADGGEIERTEKLFASCLVLDKSPGNMPEGASLAALTMSHVVSERPLETHVFLNYLHRMDFYVVTQDQTFWKLRGGKLKNMK
ncbi:hypothetical protein IEN85_10485 [Pelagicoccus sp. NFK12]|uniref:Uncharacterized protein n=1 Tax=Pelagicoccus enzymogenes TaxID=2773457 RepID=A0A927FA13_9BACT|nr:hypothetical protein [Pelagicoccus enzymogenes]MBD5779915.1 hypothetical protein [Pelagicoccus enzymogenes]